MSPPRARRRTRRSSGASSAKHDAAPRRIGGIPAQLKLRDDVLAHEVDGLHDLLVADLVRVHEAEQQVDAGGLVALARVDALVGRAEHARAGVDEVLEAEAGRASRRRRRARMSAA